jgi:hypothetical protein
MYMGNLLRAISSVLLASVAMAASRASVHRDIGRKRNLTSIRRRYVQVAAALVALFQVTPSHAGMPMPVEMKCPIGGEKFTFISTMSYSNWGSRPDGKPYGSWTFPLPVPACPKNGLVLYKDFSDDELKKLKQLLKKPDFQRVRYETAYYRVAWFMRALHDNEERVALWMINQASWQADDDSERKARYQREFAEGVARLPREPENLDWIALQARAANAWRELGEFDRAKQILDSISTASLDVPIPAEAVTGTTASGLGKTVSNYGEIQAARKKRGLLSYFSGLKALVEGQNRASEPLNMIPLREVAGKCMDMASASGNLDPYCENEAVKKQIEGFRKVREAIAAERAKER